MSIEQPKDIMFCRRFFQEPSSPKHRQYEALRAYFLEGRPSGEVAKDFGYTESSFRVMCHHFRRDPDPQFFAKVKHGPQSQPNKSKARDLIVALRKQNYSVYDISEALKDRGHRLSPTAVREVLNEEGFAPLPRRLDEERLDGPSPTIEAVADVRSFDLSPRTFATACGGLFLFVPDLIRLDVDQLANAARLPGSKMIPPAHALRASLALKLWAVERKSHIMALVADEGLALFPGLNAFPKKSYLSEYSSRIDGAHMDRLLATWHNKVVDDDLHQGESFNLDFHSIPYYGEDPVIEKHFVSSRTRRQPSVLVLLAQDAQDGTFCYSKADIRKGEEPDQIFAFIDFWKAQHGVLPRHLVFDSSFTTQSNLARLDEMQIPFITLRRRSHKIIKEIESLPRSAWRRVELDVPTRAFKNPRVFEKKIRLHGRTFRQIYVLDLGHDKPTVLLTNDTASHKRLITRYARRMLVENAISDAIRFFHMDALSSSVALKIDFDLALLVIASGLYRMFARRIRGYADAQARHIFRDLLAMPADVTITENEVVVSLHRRSHLPLLIASGLLDSPVNVPWWNDKSLRITAQPQPRL